MITYKYKLYTTKQTRHLDAMLREASWVWNHALALQKRYYRMFGKYIDVVRLKSRWSKWYGVSSRLGGQTVQEIIERLDMSYHRFFKHVQKRPPKFKQAKDFSTIVFTQWGYGLNGNVLTIRKINKRFKFSLSRPYEGVGKIKQIIIKRAPMGEYYLFIFMDAAMKPIGKTHNGASVGIDFGLKTYMTLSNGIRIHSPQFFKQDLAAKRTADRRYSKKKVGSNNQRKALIAKDRISKRIANRRDNWQWQQAHELCRNYDIICIEDLELLGITKLWGRKTADLAHGNMIRKLEYLAPRYGVKLQKIDRFFPSSKLCDCGHVHKSLALHERKWVCPVCGRQHDRDLHAANNILRQGIASLGSPRKTRESVNLVSALGRKHPRIPQQ